MNKSIPTVKRSLLASLCILALLCIALIAYALPDCCRPQEKAMTQVCPGPGAPDSTSCYYMSKAWSQNAPGVGAYQGYCWGAQSGRECTSLSRDCRGHVHEYWARDTASCAVMPDPCGQTNCRVSCAEAGKVGLGTLYCRPQGTTCATSFRANFCDCGSTPCGYMGGAEYQCSGESPGYCLEEFGNECSGEESWSMCSCPPPI